MSHTYEYSRPAVATDSVLLSRRNDTWEVLLIQRRHEPYRDHWALPGGFLDEGEDPDSGATRELQEETSLTNITLQPLGFWGHPDRDPRGHTVSLVYWATVHGTLLSPRAADDAKNVAWFPLHALPPLAFDHHKIISAAAKNLQ